MFQPPPRQSNQNYPMEILVLSACSGSKQYDPVLNCVDVDESSRTTLCQQYPDHVAPATTLYTGDEHWHVIAGVDALRELAIVDWRIVSAAFGILQPETELPAYECTFNDTESMRARATRMGYDGDELTNTETIRAVGRETGIPQAIEQALATNYDLVFVVLGKEYLLATGDALDEIPDVTTAVALAAKGNTHLTGDCHWLPATETERATLGTTWMRLRGELLREIATAATESDLERAVTDPDSLQTLWQ